MCKEKIHAYGLTEKYDYNITMDRNTGHRTHTALRHLNLPHSMPPPKWIKVFKCKLNINNAGVYITEIMPSGACHAARAPRSSQI